ncbi:MAG TPA: hypothetical protein VLH38_01850 [Patescibacteria group bacterium]|nr:hypothetical protein [Patescibacteria group bacterium]
MTVTPLPKTGNSSKFLVTVAKRGEFTIAISFTLRSKIWELAENEELGVAERMAEAIVSRHDPKLPFKEKYIFGEHNTEASVDSTIKYLRRTQL